MPRRSLKLLTLTLVLLAPTSAWAQSDDDATDDPPVDPWDIIRQMQEDMAELQRNYEDLQRQVNGLTGNVLEAGDEYYIPRTAAEFEESGVPQSFGGQYTKPFLTDMGKNIYIGGYIDLEYTNPSGNSNQEFDQHRFVPFVYADVSENVKVAAEIEFEHGSELEVEFAQMDFLFNEHANLRAGIQLLPLGRFNEVHDSPLQELTNRPLVDRYIIPTTLRDAGIGVWGDITDTVSYQTVVSNGFKGLNDDGEVAINDKQGLRSAAPQSDDLADPFENINDDLAFTGRVAWAPILGTEFGASAYTGKYDEAGDNNLTIMALDATVAGQAVPFLPDNVELLYEGAWADVERDAFAVDSGVAGNMNGYYAQANVRFEPDFLRDWQDKGWFAEDGAHFTFVTRYGHVNLHDYDIRRTSLGVNYRPNESKTVIKFDYLMDSDHGVNAGDNDGSAAILSFASYF